MKKLLVFIFAVFYLFSSTGATVHLHYCMGKLINWSLQDEGSKCHNCGMEKDGGCCNDKDQFIKNSIDQQSSTSAIELPPLTIAVGSITPLLFSELHYTFAQKEYRVNDPPLPGAGTDILIRNCIFRI